MVTEGGARCAPLTADWAYMPQALSYLLRGYGVPVQPVGKAEPLLPAMVVPLALLPV
jgi:hypothetical protein